MSNITMAPTTVGGASAGGFAAYRKGVAGPPPAYLKYTRLRDQFFAEVQDGKTALAKSMSSLNERFTKTFGGPNQGIRQKDFDPTEISDSQRLLMNFSLQYGDADFIGPELCPAFRTETPSGTYLEYLRGDEYQAPTNERGGHGTRRDDPETADYKRIKRAFSCASDSTTSFAEKSDIISVNTPVNVMFELRERADKAHARKKEYLIKTLANNPANYNAALVNTLLPGARWSDPDGDPAADILAALPLLWKGNSGSSRLVMAMNLDVWTALKDSAAIRRRLGANFAGFITAEMFMELFNLDGLLVSEAREATSNQAQAQAFGRLWPKNAILARVSTTPQMKNASFMTRFRWVVPANKASDGLEVNMWFDPERGDYGSFGYKLADSEDYQILSKDTAYLFQSVIP